MKRILLLIALLIVCDFVFGQGKVSVNLTLRNKLAVAVKGGVRVFLLVRGDIHKREPFVNSVRGVI